METYTVTVAENGYRQWWQNGALHRVDGPAVEWANGDREWYQNGVRHRVDGPAVGYANGHKEWWIHGVQLTQEEFNQQTQKSTRLREQRDALLEALKPFVTIGSGFDMDDVWRARAAIKAVEETK